jgi:two-component system OmpR family response regulator
MTTASRPKLLIVDDAPDMRTLLAKYFQQASFQTITASTGQQALDRFRRDAPDIILLDLGLPDVDGIDVCRQIRAISAVPIAMLTKRQSAADRQLGLEAGATAYLTKPFDAATVLATVRQLLQSPTP